MKGRKLARGLQSLLGVDDAEHDPGLTIHQPDAEVPAGDLRLIPTAMVDPNPFQPRRDFADAEILALAASLKTHGVIQPIVVRPVVGGRYQLAAGERRWRAAQTAALAEIPARVLELDDRQSCEIALIENLHRRDLNAIEKAQAFQDYLDRFDCTHEQLAEHLGMDRSSITNLVRLLELAEPVRQAVREGRTSFGHARALLALNDSAAQIALCQQIIDESLSVRQTEERVRQQKQSQLAGLADLDDASSAKSKSKKKTAHLAHLETALYKRLGMKVEIRPGAQKDHGTVVIHFDSNESFERLIKALGIRPNE